VFNSIQQLHLNLRQTISKKRLAYLHAFRWLYTITGFFILALGINLIVMGRDAGVDAWNILALGLTNHLPLTLGQAIWAISFGCVALAWALGLPPSLATGANVFFVGLFVDLIRANLFMPEPYGLLLVWVYLLVGVLVAGFGIGMYISSGLGAGPRDSVMLVLTRKLKWSIRKVRISIEITAATIGFILGGPVGVGTIASTLLMGPAIQKTIAVSMWLKRWPFFAEIIKFELSKDGIPQHGKDSAISPSIKTTSPVCQDFIPVEIQTGGERCGQQGTSGQT
jgi:uncharacterized membrane protein YczE